jgi:hypothetical protein
MYKLAMVQSEVVSQYLQVWTEEIQDTSQPVHRA